MTTGGPALRAVEISLQRGSRAIYSNFTIEFGRGLTAVLGPNGIGKSTLLEGLTDPARLTTGRLEYDGLVVGKELRAEEYFRNIGFLPQRLDFYRGFTVRETVEYAAWLKGMNSRAARKAADSVLAELDLAAYAKTRVHKLSGGMQQRVGIAETFVNQPAIVVLDEPTVGLDPEQRDLVRRYLKDAAAVRTIIVSTHLTDDVKAIADRVVVISGGGAIFDGKPDELASRAEGADPSGSGLEAGYLEIVRRNHSAVSE
ncbi:ATP-binding cassette domain-containing protein [Curtobacterium flaccumfaciens]|uniref:ATP-binding cassette domain-containing protein n=1 Tax=Curtobacterium flaccumfaciens TaxID=2035 RepID=UPI001128442E|nr:ATP-binding cassette domain-containing protein [Curtobacterium flaccumfaciens]TPG05170.1 ATP-binding cassette domain-containing protein [Curtobacterium flaccumfaciens]